MIVPSAAAPMRQTMSDGWRLVVACIELGARVDAAYGAAGRHRSERQEGLDREVQLRAEAAAACGRDDAHVLRRQGEDLGEAVAVHDRRLRRGVHLDAPVHHLRVTRLGLDVGVLHEGGAEVPLGDDGGAGEGGLGVAPLDDALRTSRCRRGRGGGGARRPPRPRRGEVAAGSGSNVTGTAARSSAAMVSASPTTAATASPR